MDRPDDCVEPPDDRVERRCAFVEPLSAFVGTLSLLPQPLSVFVETPGVFAGRLYERGERLFEEPQRLCTFAKLPGEWRQTLSLFVGLPCELEEPLSEHGETLGLFAKCWRAALSVENGAARRRPTGLHEGRGVRCVLSSPVVKLDGC
jgi:hypothetical protein